MQDRIARRKFVLNYILANVGDFDYLTLRIFGDVIKRSEWRFPEEFYYVAALLIEAEFLTNRGKITAVGELYIQGEKFRKLQEGL